jgi:hypothetical protein
VENLSFKTWHIYDFESEQAASESCALLSLVFKLIVTQLPSDALPLGVVSHSAVSLRKICSTMLPVVHQANVLSRAQYWPSLLADVQSGIRWSSEKLISFHVTYCFGVECSGRTFTLNSKTAELLKSHNLWYRRKNYF